MAFKSCMSKITIKLVLEFKNALHSISCGQSRVNSNGCKCNKISWWISNLVQVNIANYKCLRIFGNNLCRLSLLSAMIHWSFVGSNTGMYKNSIYEKTGSNGSESILSSWPWQQNSRNFLPLCTDLLLGTFGAAWT